MVLPAPLAQISNWEFLDEPLHKWALFVVALTFILWGWNGIIDLMK